MEIQPVRQLNQVKMTLICLTATTLKVNFQLYKRQKGKIYIIDGVKNVKIGQKSEKLINLNYFGKKIKI